MVGSHPETLVVRDWSFFCVRDKHNTLLDRWSTRMLREASDRWPRVLIFNVQYYDEEHDEERYADRPGVQVPLSLRAMVFSLKLDNVEVITCDTYTPVDAVESVKRGIIRYGGKFDLPENPHDFSIGNADQFVIANHFTWVERDDHHLAKISLDKPLNFKEIAAKRESRTIW